LAEALAGKTFVRIRNNIAFHYPERPLDFQALEQYLGDSDSIIYMAPEGYGGDVLSHLSTLAGIEPLLAINKDSDYLTALRTVWEEVTEATGLYCVLVSELIAMIVQKFIPGLSFEDVIIPDAPEAEEGLLRFFVHPPEDLEELRASLATSDPNPSPPCRATKNSRRWRDAPIDKKCNLDRLIVLVCCPELERVRPVIVRGSHDGPHLGIAQPSR
jgi:hypothetical protein